MSAVGDRIDDLSLAELEGYDPRPLRSGGYTRYKCPRHGGDKQKSLSVTDADGSFRCHNGACGIWGTVTEHKARRSAKAQTPRRSPPPLPKAEPLTPDPAAVELAKSAYKAFPGSPAQAYADRRGVPPDLAVKTGLGYYAGRLSGIDSEWLTFPLRCPMTGKPTGFYARNIRSDEQREKARVKGPKGVFGKLPGEPIIPPEVLLVEGPFEAFAVMASPGLPPVRAVIGSSHQAAIYDTCYLVVIALDDDDAGDKGTSRLVDDLNMRRLRREVGPRVRRIRRNALREKYGVKDLGDLLQQRTHFMIDIPEWPPIVAPELAAGDNAPRLAQDANRTATDRLEAAYAAIKAGVSAQRLTASIKALVAACDLSAGYTDPSDPYADVALDTLAAELCEKARLTPEIQALLDSHRMGCES